MPNRNIKTPKNVSEEKLIATGRIIKITFAVC